MRIFLIGFMGCGKSTIGRSLASVLNLTFIDLDSFLEEKYFKTIPQIFAEEGEEAFRKKEKNALEEVCTFDNVVVATGGGAPCFFDNINMMNDAGYCIFLDVEINSLIKRLLSSKTERPLIKGKTQEELWEYIGGLLAKRRPFYEQARYILKGSEILPEDVVELLKYKK